MGRVQILAISGSILLLLFILFLIRKKKIKEQYSLVWLFSVGIFLLLSLWREGLEAIALLMGIAYPPTALLLLLVIAIFLLLIQFSTIITKITEQNKRLIQEHALLTQDFKEYQAKYFQKRVKFRNRRRK